jgi:hypothetical protein
VMHFHLGIRFLIGLICCRITFLSEDALFDMICKSKPAKPSGKEDLQQKDQKDYKDSQIKLDTDTVTKIGDKGMHLFLVCVFA